MTNRIVLASSNAGKLAELRSPLAAMGMDLITQATLGITDAAETASTFVENALIKARWAAQHSGLSAIADDSGLVVPALQGEPGIYSARYAGTPQNSRANIAKLLEAMQAVPAKDRHAWFHCTLVYMESAADPAPLIFEGRWHGMILQAPRGQGGFGYDPIFLDPTTGKSAAELSLIEKLQLSHRGQALQEFIKCMHSK